MRNHHEKKIRGLNTKGEKEQRRVTLFPMMSKEDKEKDQAHEVKEGLLRESIL
jgi:hypothetical protein